MSKKPVVLMVLDGYGLSDRTEGNAIAMANTPVMDKLMKEYPFVKGNASGLYVGLPDGQMGNSEVRHMNIGAGRIIYQDLTRITKAMKNFLLLWRIARRIIPIYIFSDFYQMVVFIATFHIYMVYLRWLRRMEFLMYMYTLSLMDVIHLQLQLKIL